MKRDVHIENKMQIIYGKCFISLRVTNQSFMQMPSILSETQRGHMDQMMSIWSQFCLNAEDGHRSVNEGGTSFKIELFMDVVRLFKFRFNDPWLSIHNSFCKCNTHTQTRIHLVREKTKLPFEFQTKKSTKKKQVR